MSVVQKRFTVALDIKEPLPNLDIEVVEGDNGNVLEVALTDDGAAVDLTGCKVVAVFAKPNGTTAQQDNEGNGIVMGDEPNAFTINLYNTSFSPGNVNSEIQVFSGEGFETLITTALFNFTCRRGIANADTIVSTDEWPLLTGMLRRVEDVYEHEAVRKVAETERVEAEEDRIRAEILRDEAEQERIKAEEERNIAADWREAFIKGMTAEAVTLQDGVDASAELDVSSGQAVLRLGIPKGRDGRDAVNVALSGFMYFRIDEFGDLWVGVADEAGPPPVYINEDGELIYKIG